MKVQLVTLEENVSMDGPLVMAAEETYDTRTPGCHVTDVTSAIMKKIDPEKYSGEIDAEARLRFEAGFTWEELLSKYYAHRQAKRPGACIYRPGEVMRDGIIGTPDWMGVDMFDETTPFLLESKFTWKSCREFDLDAKKFLGWQLQMKAYLHMLDLTVCYLDVFFVNGGWEPGKMRPVRQVRRIEFTPRELSEGWTALLNTAKKEGLLAA